MLKKWFRLVLLAAWLGEAALAPAQYIPTPVGAARLPEPLPLKPVKLPDLVQGPISPQAAPPGPPEDLALPAGHTSAFQAENFAETNHLFLHAGTMALQRQRLGHSLFTYFDTTPQDFSVETGQLPSGTENIVGALDPGDLHTSFNFGACGTIGYLCQESAVELNWFFIPNATDDLQAVAPGRLNAMFSELPDLPGNNGLFLQGDVATAKLSTTIGGADLGYRYFPKNVTSIEPIMGVRYLNLNERFEFIFGDEVLRAANPIGLTDVTSLAMINSRVANHFVGAMLGFENQLEICNGLIVGGSWKSAVGADFADIRYAVASGTNSFLRDNHRTRENLSAVHEFNFFFDAYYLERLRLRAGYHVMFLMNFPEAVDQIDFNLSNPAGRADNTGDILFHGASFSLQILF